ncbi:MAG: hypothetical protein ACI9NQ_001041 [Paracoccaceae bacterium]|jgi:hypothetical protein
MKLSLIRSKLKKKSWVLALLLALLIFGIITISPKNYKDGELVYRLSFEQALSEEEEVTLRGHCANELPGDIIPGSVTFRTYSHFFGSGQTVEILKFMRKDEYDATSFEGVERTLSNSFSELGINDQFSFSVAY